MRSISPKFVTLDQGVLAALRQVSLTPARPVLLCGDVGVGKTALARWLACRRTPARFRVLRLKPAVISGRSELAILLQSAADGNAIILEDIDHWPSALQNHLASQLRQRTAPLIMTTRATAGQKQLATTQALADLCTQIYLPPLQHRRGDIPLLVESLLPPTAKIDATAVAALVRGAWPDNIKGLRAVLMGAHAVAVSQNLLLITEGVVQRFMETPAPLAIGAGLLELSAAWEDAEVFDESLNLRAAVRMVEAALLARTLRSTDANLARAAAILRTPPSTLKSRVSALAREMAAMNHWLG